MASDKRQVVPDLARQLRGLYVRVARKMCLDTEYVTGVALGRCRSQAVEAALEQELQGILAGATGRKLPAVSRNLAKAAKAEGRVVSSAAD